MEISAYAYHAGKRSKEEVAQSAPTPDWQYALGQCVDHKTGGMRSLVISRYRASNGAELYGVRALDAEDPQRDRMMMAEVLVASSL